MTSQTPNYHGYRFPPEIISHAVWLYHRFCLSFRDAEDLLAQRGVTVTYETIRHWCHAFGPNYARRLQRGRGRMGDIWYLDELFVNIQSRRQYLWRAVDQDGDLIDILVQSRRGVVARIVTGPHDAHRQDPHLSRRYDTGRPRAVIRLRISQPRTTSLPCPAGLRARRPSPIMDLYRKNVFSTRP